MDNITLAAAKKYTKDSLLGAGALIGKSVQISKIEPIIGGNRITFTYTLDDGNQKNSVLEVMNGEQGISIISANIDEKNNLTFILSNNECISAGNITIDEGNINLENYYTKEQSDKKYVQLLELDNLVYKFIEQNFVAISSDEINNIFN